MVYYGSPTLKLKHHEGRAFVFFTTGSQEPGTVAGAGKTLVKIGFILNDQDSKPGLAPEPTLSTAPDCLSSP